MKNYFFTLIIAVVVFSSCENSQTQLPLLRFEQSNGTQTSTYDEVIEFYKILANNHKSIQIQEIGKTDSNEPLHLVIFNSEGNFDLSENHGKILINNGIHPGESDGIDASMLLMKSLAFGDLQTNLTVAVIPVYNIGGALNRNSTSRANQNGPEEYGFRGNARNFDLNRDFIKADTKNARSFAQLFHRVNPDLFIDNHVSNGADYQYVITHLFTQHNKLGGSTGAFLNNVWHPYMDQAMEEGDYPITPYVNVFGRTPESGFSQFMDYPRYSTGYTALFNCLGMMVETHMLKPYKDRVYATLELMKQNLIFTELHLSEIKALKSLAWQELVEKGHYPLSFELDRQSYVELDFKGIQGENIKSNITGGQRLKYYKDSTYTTKVKYYNQFRANQEIEIPSAYIIPQGQWKVIERLKENNIDYTKLEKDQSIQVEIKRIKSYETRKNAYEGHYVHYNTQTTTQVEYIEFRKGDYLVPTAQYGIRYLIETLEPEATDSFFNWNYFDAILQQKEGFSAYVFEDYAEEFLNNNPDIKNEFEELKLKDTTFNENSYAQLNWIFKKSPLYEDNHLRYPIFRKMKK
ncbi:MAG: M14 family metallopeptidase [Flavobacteriaceae bacterium]